MTPQNQHIDFGLLAGKYLAGEATDHEVELLETIVKTDKEKKKLFYQYKQAWRIAGSADFKFDKQKAWTKIEDRITENTTNIRILKPESGTHVLKVFLRIAAVVLIILGGGASWLFYTQFRTITVFTAHETKTIYLNDGSEVTLNRESQITYPVKFRGNTRKVNLEGDAYFQVASQPEKPFIIHTTYLDVEVLGTSFYVNARPSEPEVEVIVSTGRVALKAPDMAAVELTAENRGVFIKADNQLVKEESADRNFLAWKTRRMVFENTSLKNVAATLGKTYSVNVELETPELQNCMLTATFENLPLEDVLAIITETFNLTTRRNNGIIRLSGSPCP